MKGVFVRWGIDIPRYGMPIFSDTCSTPATAKKRALRHSSMEKNLLAIETAKSAAEQCAFGVTHVTLGIQGEAKEVGAGFEKVSRQMIPARSF